MPFKRAGWLQPRVDDLYADLLPFQCPLSGLVGCNDIEYRIATVDIPFQCPLSGLVGCNTLDVTQ